MMAASKAMAIVKPKYLVYKLDTSIWYSPKIKQTDMHVLKLLSANSLSIKPALSSLESSFSFWIFSHALTASEHDTIKIH